MVCGDPDAAGRLADRLGGHPAEGADGLAPVRLGGVPLDGLPLEAARTAVLVQDKDPVLLSGTLRELLDVPSSGAVGAREALEAAQCGDVLDALAQASPEPDADPMEVRITERGRSLSGGQRQRLALARSLVTDPEVLVLDEPTSAVDSHTEARVADGLRRLRAGRTTVVFTSSPLLLDRADRVVLVHEGRAARVRHPRRAAAVRAAVPGGGVPRARRARPPRARPRRPTGTARPSSGAARPGRHVRGRARPARRARRARRGVRMIGMAPPQFDPAAPESATTLPVGSPATVRAYARSRCVPPPAGLRRAGRGEHGRRRRVDDRPVPARRARGRDRGGHPGPPMGAVLGLFAAALLVQAVFVRLVRLRGAMLGEEMLADLREDFLVRSVRLPPGVLERAGTGDLLSRITTDVDRLAEAMRKAVPELAIGVVWVALLLGGMAVAAPPLALAVLVAAPLLLAGCRWYFRRAPQACRSEAAGYAAVAAALAETVDAGRTVEAHRLGARRVALSDRRIAEWTAWERYTLYLRTVLLPVISLTHTVVLVAVLLIGGVLVLHGRLDVGQLTTGALLAQMLVEPIGIILRWYDELQVAQVSLARLVGVREVDPEGGDGSVRPEGRDVRADAVRFGYREGVDVLHGVSLAVAPGTRLALVGPSGAGKSTLGRLLAGVYGPRSGRSPSARRSWRGCRPSGCGSTWLW